MWRRNPVTSTERIFEADGVRYDAYKDPGSAAEVYLRRCAV